MLKILDLFSGIGGFSLAGKWAGFETVQFVEKDFFCQKVLRKHWPNVPIHDDVRTFHWGKKVDLITGGFPCQGFSIAGKRKGINDERYLWPEFFRIIRECKPTWIIAENVVGIVEMELDNIIIDLESENYETQTFIIPACAANAPHRRDRVWIIANCNGKRCNNRIDNREIRSIQENIIGNMAQIQSEWEKFKPKSWQTMYAGEYLAFNYFIGRINDGLRNGVDRSKSLGNAIVPQIVYPIMKMIYEIESCLHR